VAEEKRNNTGRENVVMGRSIICALRHDQVKQDGVVWVCSMHGLERKFSYLKHYVRKARRIEITMKSKKWVGR
jgi:hypothetical protein